MGALDNNKRPSRFFEELLGNEEPNLEGLTTSKEEMYMNAADNKPKGYKTSLVQSIFCILLGIFLILAGIGHLSVLRQEFLAQVPTWLPIDGDLVVVLSGIVEILLGVGLIILPGKYRVITGWVTAAFFVLIFPGNISQYVNQIDAFGLDSDRSRFVRLFFQPVLVIWAIWSTGAWRAWRYRKSKSSNARISNLPDDQVESS
jgi:uncharacterized membrane protein